MQAHLHYRHAGDKRFVVTVFGTVLLFGIPVVMTLGCGKPSERCIQVRGDMRYAVLGRAAGEYVKMVEGWPHVLADVYGLDEEGVFVDVAYLPLSPESVREVKVSYDGHILTYEGVRLTTGDNCSIPPH